MTGHTRQSRRPRHGLRALALVGASALVATGCGPKNGENSLRPNGPAAHTILNLFTPFFFIAVVIGIGVLAATIILPLKFRYREGNQDPKQVHGHTTLEITWTIIPALILAVMAIFTVPTIFKLARVPKGPDVVHVDVMGKQWWWEYRYPKEGIYTANELHIPIDRPVVLTLTSDNVIHDFWVPELAGKKDVVPGETHTSVIEAETPGTYLGQCAEFCGLGHADMRLRVIAQTQADYDAWVRGEQAPVTAADKAFVLDTLQTKYGCTSCHMFQGISTAQVGPNLTHLASRTTFAAGKYDLTRENLWKWVYDAPSRKPNSCPRLPQPKPCAVGMPSMKASYRMTESQAQEIADFLLTLK
jgi:cytochrome c oxidase subunit II